MARTSDAPKAGLLDLSQFMQAPMGGLFPSDSAPTMQPQGQQQPMQMASIRETSAPKLEDAKALAEQLQSSGFQAYVLPGKSGGQHVIRFWPLDPNQGNPGLPANLGLPGQ